MALLTCFMAGSPAGNTAGFLTVVAVLLILTAAVGRVDFGKIDAVVMVWASCSAEVGVGLTVVVGSGAREGVVACDHPTVSLGVVSSSPVSYELSLLGPSLHARIPSVAVVAVFYPSLREVAPSSLTAVHKLAQVPSSGKVADYNEFLRPSAGVEEVA